MRQEGVGIVIGGPVNNDVLRSGNEIKYFGEAFLQIKRFGASSHTPSPNTDKLKNIKVRAAPLGHLTAITLRLKLKKHMKIYKPSQWRF